MWLVFFLLINFLKTDFWDKFWEDCQSISYRKLGRSDQNRLDKVSDTKNYFSSRYKHIIKYYSEDSTNSLFTAIRPFAALLIILMILTLFCTAIFTLFCLGKFLIPEEKVNKKLILLISLILLIIIIIFLVVLIVFIGISVSEYK